MPKPESVSEQVREQFNKKIMKAKGIEKIQLFYELDYLSQVVDGLSDYNNLTQIKMDYFVPLDKNGNLEVDLLKKRAADMAEYYDKRILGSFNKLCEENPGHSNEWYRNRFHENPAFVSDEEYGRLSTELDFALEDYNDSRKVRKALNIKTKNDTVWQAAIRYELTKRREKLPPKEVIALEEAENMLMHGSNLKIDKLKKRAVITGTIKDTKTEGAKTENTKTEGVKTEDTKIEGAKTEDAKIESAKIESAEDQWMNEWENVELESDAAYKARQKELQKSEKPFDKNNNLGMRFFEKFDYSFIKDDALKKCLNELHQSDEYYDACNCRISKDDYAESKELFRTIDEFSQNLKDADHSYWINSGKYRDVKKNLQNLRKILVQGDVPANRQAIQDAYKKLSDSCYAYQIKNPGLRKDPVGNKRKEIIFGLSDFCDKQLQKYNPEKQQDEKIELEEEKQPVKKELVPFAKLSGSSQSKNYVKPVNKEMENNKVMGHQKGGK